MASLPHRRGFYVVHEHDEGEPCWLVGPRTCRYERSILGRILRAIKVCYGYNQEED